MSLICEKYLTEKYDENGSLIEYKVTCPENFNFAFDVMDALAEKKPNDTAMLWTTYDGERKEITYKEVVEKSNQCANFLKELGIKKGDMVMLILKRHYEWWYFVMALHKLGAVAIPATNQLMVKDLVYRFNSASVSAIICTAQGGIADCVDEAQNQTNTLKTKIICRGERDGWISYNEIEKYPKTFERPTGDQSVTSRDPILLYFTSGTTGMPKMVLHDHSYPLGHIYTARHWHNVEEGGLHLTLAETGWAKSVWGKLYGQWLCETAILVIDYDRFEPEALLSIMADTKLTTFCAPPTIYRFLIQHDLKKFDLSALKYCTIAGEALNPEVFERFKEATGIELMEGYGQTETTISIANNRYMRPRPGSMGKPVHQYDVDIVDGDNQPVKAGEIGEIVIRAQRDFDKRPYGLFCGYYLNEKMTTDIWHDGLYHTGDLVWCDEDGYYWYVGRTDDIIKSSGYRIGPFEVESALMEHDAVVECAVTGVPDPIRGQLVKATIVLGKKYAPSDELKKDIQDYVKKVTAPYKYPRIIEFVDELPKTISGKIRRTEIREKDSNK